METEIVYFDPSVPKVLISQILQPVWKSVVFSGLGPVVFKKNYNFEIEKPDEVLTKTLRGGVCGSDLHLVALDFALDVSPTIVPSPDPRQMGHECVAEITEVGSDVSNLTIGDRVIVQKGPSCYLHQADKMCPRCEEGDFWLCEQAGKFAEFTEYHAAGGWSTGFKYHKDQLFFVPEKITSDEALLIEPLSCALRGVLRASPKEDDKILIIGAGTIGLCTLVCVKAILPDIDVTVLAKYDFQVDMAKKFGATHVISNKEMDNYLGQKLDAVLYKGYFGNKTFAGGFNLIYDCVGKASTIQNSLRWTKGKGKVMVLGVNLKQGKFDYSPVWYQEVDLLGSCIHGTEEWNGKKKTTFQIVSELLLEKKINPKISEIITHRFDLKDYKTALKTAFNKKKYKAIKVIFDYSI